jgi:hypothetical protein
MTFTEALYVWKHRGEYDAETVAYALDILTNEGWLE